MEIKFSIEHVLDNMKHFWWLKRLQEINLVRVGWFQTEENTTKARALIRFDRS